MQHFGPFSVAIAFWIFVTVAAVAGIVADYKKRGLALQPLRAAIERGQQLDPQLIERLMDADRRDEPMNPIYMKVGGIVTVAAGVGVAVLSFFVSQVMPASFYPVLGAGIVAVCVGGGLLVAARVVESHNARLPATRGP